MSLSLYLDVETWVHRLDGRTKVLALLGLFVLELVFSDPRYLIVVMVFVLAGVAMASAFGNVRKMWLLLVLLFIYSTLLWPFFVDGQTPLLTLGGQVLTKEGVLFGIAMGLRLDAMLMSGVLLLSTTRIEEFSQALQRLGVPAPLGFSLSLAFRWVPTLLGAMGTVIQAQRSRGLDLGRASLFGKIRRYPPLVVPLIGHTLRQTTLLAMALESKGFGPGQPRTPYVRSSMTMLDFSVLIVISVLVGISIWLRWHGYGTI